MNKFGGNWTEEKIEILVEYASAYLTIMNIHAERWGWDLLYFDGFAGSGNVKINYAKEIAIKLNSEFILMSSENKDDSIRKLKEIL
jgi:hypothetical protein